MSGVYEELGVHPLINAAGTQTRYGGVPLPQEVVQAMAEAASACVRMEDLQEAAGRVIGEGTGAGGGYVTARAAAGLTLSAAGYWATIDARGVAPLEEMCRIAHHHGLPVIVDAAAALPPAENLRRFIAAGADLVSFSGGKAIMGPQATGILCGRRELIASV